MSVLRKKEFYLATATLLGTIIGGGGFGIPYVFSQSGYFPGMILLIFLTLVITGMHLMYAEIVACTPGEHRFVGYVEYYLGVWGRRIVRVTFLFGSYGVLLAYIILGGVFLHTLLSPVFGGSVTWYSLIITAFVGFAIYRGLKLISSLELWMVALLLVTVGIILFRGIPEISPEHFFVLSWKQVFLPYGVILFALSGSSAIPEIVKIVERKSPMIRWVIISSGIVSLVVYGFFSSVVLGVSGPSTTPDALGGLVPYLGSGVILLGSLFGLLSVVTSFLAIGLVLKNSLQFDYHLGGATSWILTMLVPLLLFFFATQDFIWVMSLIGAVDIGFAGVLLVMMYHRLSASSKKKSILRFSFPYFFGFLISLMFIVGMLLELKNIL